MYVCMREYKYMLYSTCAIFNQLLSIAFGFHFVFFYFFFFYFERDFLMWGGKYYCKTSLCHIKWQQDVAEEEQANFVWKN